MNPALRDIIKEELQKLLDANFIYPISDSQWVSPLVLTPKKDGRWHICIDYRELNKTTLKDYFPLPFIDQEFHITIVDRRGKSNVVVDYLSTLNKPGETTPVDDDFPDEHLFVVSKKSPWFADIANYLVIKKLPPHLSACEKRNIIQKSAAYSWIQGDLFYVGADLIIHRCVRGEEVFDILKSTHD
eukprot:PITA_11144